MSHATCHGYLQAHGKRYYIYRDDATGPPPYPSNSSAITLEKILHDAIRPRLTRRQRFALALTLASSFLQLAGTPWIKSHWTKSDVVFFQDPEDPTVVVYERPFVCRDFLPADTFAPVQGPPTPLPARLGDDTIRGFESLGIVLVELCFGTPIELHPLCRQDVEAQSSDSLRASPAWSPLHLVAAIDWLRDVTGEAGLGYAEAVSWCLTGSKTMDTTGDRWRSAMLEKVVEPLGVCCSCLAMTPGVR
jgi:hypothetical protein